MSAHLDHLESFNQRFADADAQDILAFAHETFGDKLTMACSFGVEDMVLLHLLSEAGLKVRVFTLDTGRLPESTYIVMDQARHRYKMEFDVYFPKTEVVEALVRLKGPQSYFDSVDNRKECCRIRKVEPLSRALSGKQAWITGLRAAQSVTRRGLPVFEHDEGHGMVKVNPLTRWSEQDLWDFVQQHNVPFNRLHDEGYPSIGCAPCTRPVPGYEKGREDLVDIRSGRWWWESPDQKECGLHPGSKGSAQ